MYCKYILIGSNKMEKKSKVIALVNQKGGVTKTTTSINLAFGLASRGFDVLLIDGDTQESSLDWSDVRSQSERELTFTIMGMPKSNMAKEIQKVKSKYDFTIIDSAGRQSDLTRQAIVACDVAIVPNSTSAFDAWATKATMNSISEILGYREFSVYLLMSKVNVNTIVFKEVREYLIESYDYPMLDCVIADRTSYQATSGNGLSIYESKDKKAIQDMDVFINELFEKESF